MKAPRIRVVKSGRRHTLDAAVAMQNVRKRRIVDCIVELAGRKCASAAAYVGAAYSFFRSIYRMKPKVRTVRTLSLPSHSIVSF
jgi:hypothetical protein